MILFNIVMQENERGLQFNYGMEVIKRKGDASSKDITITRCLHPSNELQGLSSTFYCGRCVQSVIWRHL